MPKVLYISCLNCPNRECIFSQALTPDCLKKLDELKNTVKYDKGQCIYIEGTAPSGVYCIYQGKVKITKQNPDGKEQIVYLAKEGDLLGTKDVMYSKEFSTSACAIEESVVCHIPKNIFTELIEKNPALHGKINNHLCRILDLIEDKILNFSQRTVRERIAINILNLQENFGVHNGNEILIDVPLSREDMANMVGTATETVIRILSEFRKEGMLNFTGKRMTITNITTLRKVASF